MGDKARIQAELDLLSTLEDGDVVSQLSLSRRISVSVGLINALLKRAVLKGYVKARAAPYKRYAYYLTPKGFAEKSRLVAEYLESSLEFFRQAREEYLVLLLRARACGARRVILFGHGELAEIALLAAREAELEIVGVFDRETNAERLHGQPVLRGTDNFEAGVEIVVITASRQPQAAYDEAYSCFGGKCIVAPAFLRIMRGDGESLGWRSEE